jgi:hypothetical protein
MLVARVLAFHMACCITFLALLIAQAVLYACAVLQFVTVYHERWSIMYATTKLFATPPSPQPLDFTDSDALVNVVHRHCESLLSANLNHLIRVETVDMKHGDGSFSLWWIETTGRLCSAVISFLLFYAQARQCRGNTGSHTHSACTFTVSCLLTSLIVRGREY